jgi:hypothetical protein
MLHNLFRKKLRRKAKFKIVNHPKRQKFSIKSLSMLGTKKERMLSNHYSPSFDKLRIYISLDDIGKLDPSSIKFEVTKETVDLKIYQYKNANWRYKSFVINDVQDFL